MRLRSLLFVPGDRPERFDKAAASGADAIILDLEDSVAPAAKDAAARAAAEWLSQPRSITAFVRINPMDSARVSDDLSVAMAADGIVLPKAEGAASILALLEQTGEDCPPILPIATETPAAIFALGTYAQVTRHLCGVTWGAEDLPAAIGALTSREENGGFTPPYEVARSLTLFAAHAAGVPAIETVYPSLRDLDGLAAYAARGARDGFTGMLAIHPAQIGPINAAFTPDEAAVIAAQRIVDAFAASPGVGAIQLDGKMVDLPHFKQAEAVLARAAQA